MAGRFRKRFDRPVRVTCYLASPMAGLDPPYLDAICEFVMSSRIKSIQETLNGHRHAYSVGQPGQPIPVDAVGKIPIPIKRTRVNGLPIPHASSPIVGFSGTDDVAFYTTAFPLDKVERLEDKERTKIMQSGGRFKSFRLPLRTRLIDKVVWFAVLREQATELRKILRRVTSIGKKTSQGWGVVSSWDVDLIDEDLSWYAESPGGSVLMRPLPAEMDHPRELVGCRRSYGGCCGPYWQRDFWTEIIEPC